ncbi:MAG: alpha/beta hydrolase fold domain-containing protein [Clostridia bacterium]|nr:alpha/beta hydrolase fold domain-containing protein [Clostridia bacterium]
MEGYQWLQDQGYAPENIVIAGNSAGGGLSIGTTLRLRDEGIALPKCLVLSSPWADVSQEGESYTYNRKNDASFGSLSDDAVGHKALPTTYAGNESVYNLRISPVYAEYEGMPPMLIQAGTTEMLLSDSETVAARTEAVGVNVRLIEYRGMWHTFYTAMKQFREQKEARQATENFIHAL